MHPHSDPLVVRSSRRTLKAFPLPTDILLLVFEVVAECEPGCWHQEELVLHRASKLQDWTYRGHVTSGRHRIFDLKNIVLVCRYWNDLATSLLYDVVEVHSYESLRSFYRTLVENEAMRCQVRTFKLRQPVYSNRRALDDSTLNGQPMLLAGLAELLSSSTDYHFLSSGYLSELFFGAPFIGALQIKELRMSWGNGMERGPPLGPYSNVQTLTLVPFVFPTSFIRSDFPHLTCLRVLYGNVSYQINNLLHLFNNLRRLELVSVKCCEDDVTYMLGRCALTLGHLTFLGVRNVSGPLLVPLSWSKKLDFSALTAPRCVCHNLQLPTG